MNSEQILTHTGIAVEGGFVYKLLSQ